MASAKCCDICGELYLVPEVPTDSIWDENMNTSMVRILRRDKTPLVKHDVMQYDACDKCLQDVLDYILSKSAAAVEKIAK